MTTWTLADYTPEEDEAWAIMEKEQQYEQEKKERKGNMYWNNRVVKETVKYTHKGEEIIEYYYEISEVYYNEKDEPCGYCKSSASGETFDEMRAVYSRMAEAFKYDVLDADTDFNHKFEEDEEGGHEFA